MKFLISALRPEFVDDLPLEESSADILLLLAGGDDLLGEGRNK